MSNLSLDKRAKITTWAAQLVAAAIFGMAAPAKFMADPTAVAIFEKLGAEPMGRLATGGFEVLAVVLLLIPATAQFGGILGAGLMVGAVFSHLTVLGISIDGDPSMFVMALVALSASSTVVWTRRSSLFGWASASPTQSAG
jgi:putative oxidoreductase